MPKKQKKKNKANRAPQSPSGRAKAAIAEARRARAQEAMAGPGPVPEITGAVQEDPVREIQDAPVPAPAGDPGSGRMPPDGAPYMRQPAGRASSPVSMRLENARDAGGDCWHFDVKLPRLADLRTLFDGIRSTRPREETGTVYVRTDVLGADAGNAQLSYAYKQGMFARAGGSNKALALADLLGLPITRIRATGGWGRMDYFVNVAGENADPDAFAGTED